MFNSIFTMYSRRTIILIAGILIALLGFNASSLLNTAALTEENNSTAPQSVSLASISSLSAATASQSFVGTIQAVSQAQVQAEAAGRVTLVAVAVGDVVRAGQVIAQLENAAQRAALTQAEGAYEATIASTEQSNQRDDSSKRNADSNLQATRNQAISTLRSAYTTNKNTLLNTIDQFYANPSGPYPGIRISNTDTSFLRTERQALQDIMPKWENDIEAIEQNDDPTQLLNESETYTLKMIAILDELVNAVTRANSSDILQGQSVSSFAPALLSQRSSLNATLQAIKSSQASLVAANEAITQAQIGDDTSSVSLSAAQVKQSLGALQAAQANLAKTIIRSPIAGKVNSLNIAVGEFVGNSTPVAEVINDSAYEITIYVTATERASIAVGDDVLINQTLPGVISSIAPALDSTTQKIAVTIALESTTVLSGTTATVTLSNSAPNATSTLQVPLTAIAFSLENGAVLTVVDGIVTAIPVTLGQVRSNQIEISGEITADTEIITDARGLLVGTAVTSE